MAAGENILLTLRALLCSLSAVAVILAAAVPHRLLAWTSDNRNGTFTNPVLTSLMFDDDGAPLVYNGTEGHPSVAVLDPDTPLAAASQCRR